MTYSKQVAKYCFADVFSAILSWGLFFLFRKINFEQLPLEEAFQQTISNSTFFVGLIVIPIFWLLIHYLSGYYNFIFKKNIFIDVEKTFKTVIVGVLVVFFALLLDDDVRGYKHYYESLLVLSGLQFITTLFFRLLLTTQTLRRIKNGKLRFNTLIIGNGIQALEIYNELLLKNKEDGNYFVGYVDTLAKCDDKLAEHLPLLGHLDDLPVLIGQHKIDELIIAIDPADKADIGEINSWLGYSEITVKAIAGLHQELRGQKKITNLLGTPLIEVKHELLPLWQQAIKNIIDVLFSLLAILLLSPFFILCALGIKLTSKGPIFFKQERIGRNGKPFMLYKFRSMYTDAEKNGPNLATQNDNRCTPFGKFMRKTKLDEIPNFFNVLNRDMSLVGPRPERQFYIDQIVKITPRYKQLQKIKPGITSLGQVRYGYASDVEQMVQRLRFDMLYMENMSLYTDFLIIYYTIRILFKGRHV